MIRYKRNRYVWIVEMLVDNRRESTWEATVGCALTRDDARKVLAFWKDKNHSDRYRIRRYASHEARP